jgi:hypothetical protein
MAIMASCDHFIISVGTFGWWCAWLGAYGKGGDVLYYKDEFVMEHEINKDDVSIADYFPSDWIEWGDDGSTGSNSRPRNGDNT